MNTLRATYQLVVVSVVLAVSLAALPAATLAGLPAAGTSSPSDVSGPEFVSSYVTDQRGDVARIAVRMPGADEADVRITNSKTDFETKLTLRDDDNDGIVTLEFNTYLAGQKSAFGPAADGDAVSVWTQTDVDGLLATGEYRLTVDGSEKNAILKIEPRSTDGIATMVAPEGAFERLRSADSIRRSREAGNLTARPAEETAPVARHDTMVLRIDASGLSGPLAAQPGSDVTERFRALVASDVVSFDVEQTESTVGTSQRRARLLLNRSGLHVVGDVRKDRYYVVVDTASAHYRRGPDGVVESGLPGRAEFAANLTVDPGGELGVDAPKSAETTFEMVERAATLRTHAEAGGNYLRPASSQSVAGATTVAPGTTVEVELGTTGGTFETSKTVTVEQGEGRGTLAAIVDLSGLAEGDTLEASARDHRGPLSPEPVPVTVRSPAARLTGPRLEVEDHQLYAAVDANQSRGGLISVRANNESGRLLGATTAEPGSSTVRVPLENLPEKDTPMIVTALRDLDGDGELSPSVDVPYEQSNSPRPVALTLTLYELPPSPTPTPSPTEAGTETVVPSEPPPSSDTPSQVETTEPPTSSSTTGGDQLPVDVPGLGVIGALVALGASLLLIGRRQ